MSTSPICWGCQGKGWVDSQFYGPTICPLCKGTGVATLKFLKSDSSEQTKNDSLSETITKEGN